MTRYGFYQSKFGIIKIGYEGNEITSIKRVNKHNPENEPSEVSDVAFLQLTEYFAGNRKNFDFPLKLCGTDFQLKVWNELRKIPYGETRTYKEIAELIGKGKAFRAVGMANHHNPVWVAVPCHRVIGTNGELKGYAGGVDMKKMLLDIEKSNK